ncbi:MAG: hypothetical protein WAZ94_02625 [Phycisphaerales bacterium]
MGTIPAYFAWAVLALIGLDALLAAWLLRRDPALGKPRCRSCWYDMAGAKGTRCPECGTEHSSPHDLLRRRLRWGRFGLALAPLPVLLFAAIRLGAFGTLYYAVMPKWQRVGSREVCGHTITHYRARNPAVPEERVVVRGRVNYELVDSRVWAGVTKDSAPRTTTTQPLLGDGSLDCTGDGEPDLIIEGFSGGAHCCTTYAVLQLGTGARSLGVIEAGNAAYWRETDTPGVLEMLGADYTFDYWLVPHVECPAPGVVLRWDGAGFSLYTPSMARPAPSDAGFAEMVATLRSLPARADFSGRTIPPPELWREMLDLAYSGHEPLAWELCDAAWNPSWGDREAFEAELRAQWANSPFRAMIEAWGRAGESPGN